MACRQADESCTSAVILVRTLLLRLLTVVRARARALMRRLSLALTGTRCSGGVAEVQVAGRG
jgi:hypothetical protein